MIGEIEEYLHEAGLRISELPTARKRNFELGELQKAKDELSRLREAERVLANFTRAFEEQSRCKRCMSVHWPCDIHKEAWRKSSEEIVEVGRKILANDR